VGKITLVTTSLGLYHVSDKLSVVMTTCECDCCCSRHAGRPLFTGVVGTEEDKVSDFKIGHYSTDRETIVSLHIIWCRKK
jgi:hypothetical protein